MEIQRYTPPDGLWGSGAALDGGSLEAMAVSPLASGRLDPPDICLIYATPAQMILFVNGLQWTGYRKLEWGCVGESSCADSWGLLRLIDPCPMTSTSGE